MHARLVHPPGGRHPSAAAAKHPVAAHLRGKRKEHSGDVTIGKASAQEAVLEILLKQIAHLKHLGSKLKTFVLILILRPIILWNTDCYISYYMSIKNGPFSSGLRST